MKAAKSLFLRWISGIKPALASSASRRSAIDTSVGHFMSMPPSSVGKLWVGRFSTAPPDSMPRIREHQPYSLNERLMLVAMAYAALAQVYLELSAEPVSSSKLKASTGLVLAP